jgi:formate-dependent phosphoribosylglycinamide formyltransferase (GAR transformylase)
VSTAIFACPVFSPAATQMIEAALSLPGVHLGVVSQDPLERLPADVASRVGAHWRVPDVTDTTQLTAAVTQLRARLGGIDRLFGAFEQLQVPLAEVRALLDIPGMRPDAARRFRDKALMKETLRAAGVPVARHALVTNANDAWTFVRAVGYPVVAKPPAGAGARNTERLGDDAALARWLEEQPVSSERPLLLEEFLTGREHSLETVSINGRAIWHSLTHYDPTPLEVLEQPWIQWCVVLPRDVDDSRYDDIRAVGAKALRALGMDTGVSHCEWFRRADGTVAISEIAARPPGAQITTLISRAHDIDFVRAWVMVQLFGTFEIPERKYAVGAAYLRGQGRGVVTSLDGLDVVAREFGPLITDYRLPSPGQSPSGSYEGEGFIILRHPETDVVVRALRRLISTLRVRLG